ncbi:MAG TPA: glycerate kinase [Opitutales bacterium]|nr:glycerate kinase [Opitutales bacterium]
MRVLLAFDKFKHALSAPSACAAAAIAIREAFSNAHPDEAPLTDGGEGFGEILTHAAGGHLHKQRVHGPRLEPVEAHWGEVELAKVPKAALDLLDLPDHGKLAVIEMAQAGGLALLAPEQRDPWQATSFGVGELLGRAADAHARAVLLGIGGSATNDLGLGALAAVGLEFRNANGDTLRKITPAKFGEVARIAGEPWPHLPDLRIACDVRNPLLGPNGATAVFGPQKGLATGDFPRLEKAVGAMAKKLCAHFDQPKTLMMEPGAGAAGGLGFGLRVAAAAKLVPGFPLVSAWLNLEERVQTADLVLTGEGRFDDGSLSGKAVGALADLALKYHKKLVIFAGSVDTAAAATLRARAPEGRVQLHALSPAHELAEASHRATRARLQAKIKTVF